MFKTTFNPGPSQVCPEVKQDIAKAIDQKVLEISHRSKEFTQISKKAILELRKFYQIPEDYKIFYTASASECWWSIITNTVDKTSFHFVNGNFSGQFAKTAKGLNKNVIVNEVENGQQNDFKNTKIPDEAELITVCYNESSSGVMCQEQEIEYLHTKYPDKLLAVDTTSSACIKKNNIKNADFWYYSVQKGTGLPAGLGLLFVSPKAWKKSLKMEEEGKTLAGLFTYSKMWKKMENEVYQTINTPNVLNIFLLGEQMERYNQKGLEKMQQEAQEKYQMIENLIEENPKLDFYIKKPEHRSFSVITIEADPEIIKQVHQKFTKKNIIMGGGYGTVKEKTFRIANFPAVTKKDFEEAVEILKKI